MVNSKCLRGLAVALLFAWCFRQHAAAQPPGVSAAERAQLLKERDRHNRDFQNLYERGDFREALVPGNATLAIERRVLGEQHLDTAGTYNVLGNCLSILGDHPAARANYEKCLAIQQKMLGEEHIETAKSYSNLGVLFRIIGDHASSRAYHERSLAIRRKLLGEEHLETAQSYNNLGSVLHDLGDFVGARVNYERSLTIKRRVLGEQHTATAASYNNLGILLRELGDYTGARTACERCLAIQRKALGSQHIDTAQAYHNLGAVLALLGETAAARTHYEAGLAIWRKGLGEEHPLVAESYNALGLLLKGQGDKAGALAYYEKALTIQRNSLGELHANTAGYYNNLGVLLTDLGEYAAARDHYEKCLAIRRQILGETHPDTIALYKNLTVLETQLGDWPAAAGWMQKERRAARQHVARVLPTLNEFEQAQFLDVDFRQHSSLAMSLALRNRDNPVIVRLAAGWLLNSKGVAQEALAGRALLGRVHDPKLAPLVQELLQVRTSLSKLSLSAAGADEVEARQKRLDELYVREAFLARQLVQAGSNVQTGDPWVETDVVRKTLQPQARLVEIARFDRWSLGEKNSALEESHYLAFVIPPAGSAEVQLVDLGPAAEIETLVKQWRTAIAKTATEGSGETIDPLVQQLAERIWKPLAPHLVDAKTIHLCPDGALWLVPWAALPTGADRMVVEDYTLNYLIAGRDLIAAPASTKSTVAAMFADADYDLSPQQTQEAAKAVLRAAYREEGAATASRSRLGRAGRLPGTADEAALVIPNLAKLAGQEPTLYRSRYALENVAKVLSQPKVAVFATHGFFLPDQESQADQELASQHDATRGAIPSTQAGQPFENPLARCGLLFAGCNPRIAGQAGSGDDGVLTGMEVVGIDFRGTELVVLSACESGVGSVNTGEGVAGLRQAFQLAGAQSVLATLWQIRGRAAALY